MPTYRVVTHVMVNGKRRNPGDLIDESEILRREPHRLGSLIRRGHIALDAQKTGPDFGAMTKKALLEYAAANDLDPPAGTAAELRDWMKENA